MGHRRVVCKYKLKLGVTDVPLPQGSRPLCAQRQGHSICLWAEADPDAPIVAKRVQIVGTGHEVPDQSYTYLDTVQEQSFVWHVYYQA